MRISDWSSDVCSSDLYAATIHKSQGVTVDQAHVLATPGMDRHSAYVALSRHRDGVQLHYGRDDFADDRQLTRTLGRERAKDMASDYGRDPRSEEHTSELQSLMRISYAVFCLKTKKT